LERRRRIDRKTLEKARNSREIVGMAPENELIFAPPPLFSAALEWHWW
jgi:hypothetical protein